MTLPLRLREILAELVQGNELDEKDKAYLSQASSIRAGGRPPRTDLTRFQDEFGRAMAYAFARAEGATYREAVSRAASSLNTSERRIKGGIAWLRDLTGMLPSDLVKAIREDRQVGERLRSGGLEELSIREMLLFGTVAASCATLERTVPPEIRASIYVQRASDLVAYFERAFERTWKEVAAILASFPRDQSISISAIEVASLIDAVAARIADEEIGNLMGAKT